MRRCVTCGAPYLRRNLLEIWTVRNVGHRTGWVKAVVRQCLTCSSESQSSQLLRVARVPISARGGLRVVRGNRSTATHSR